MYLARVKVEPRVSARAPDAARRYVAAVDCRLSIGERDVAGYVAVIRYFGREHAEEEVIVVLILGGLSEYLPVGQHQPPVKLRILLHPVKARAHGVYVASSALRRELENRPERLDRPSISKGVRLVESPRAHAVGVYGIVVYRGRGGSVARLGEKVGRGGLRLPVTKAEDEVLDNELLALSPYRDIGGLNDKRLYPLREEVAIGVEDLVKQLL